MTRKRGSLSTTQLARLKYIYQDCKAVKHPDKRLCRTRLQVFRLRAHNAGFSYAQYLAFLNTIELEAPSLNPPRKKKTRETRICESIKQLNAAIAMPQPDILINLRGGFAESPAAKKFTESVRSLVAAYKDLFGVEKVDVELYL